MSADGPGLFEDDTAHDVREQFIRLLAETQEGAAATRRLLAAWEDSLQRSDEGPIFWLALAATQWRYGCLQPEVSARAIEIIVSGSELARWHGSPYERQRAAVLGRLKKQLTRPQPVFKFPMIRKEHVPVRHLIASPDGYCQAQAVSMSQRTSVRSYVVLWSPEGGPVVFDAECDYRQIQLKWLGSSVLEIAVPSDVRLVRKQMSGTVAGREIAIVIRNY